ncbi:PAS domain-containing sensor histidine kinase [Flavobacterium sp. 14A]|uniref:PAS domain-containing sensor histidine kinase n=1 Tax=Flavobacterium sp. 14A TaxID=2735896 RepID=UPI0015700099|nr:PAS domain-containing sensor histidine kinase [Flavobacterium sp. 14A]NRT12605.1 PAS domain S-box-containing protein [Flavobacterium sp. 14A]
MKNKSTQIALIYLLIALFAAIIFHKLSIRYADIVNLHDYNFIKDIMLVILTAGAFRFILAKNDKRNNSYLIALKETNDEIKESNDRYNIVAKATSDIIRDWNIQSDKLEWSIGIETIFGYQKNQLGETSAWWFDNIHPEDSIRMSIKLYSFLEEKTDKWQDEYRFKCADGSYKYVLDKGFIIKDKLGKPVRMIGAIQDITKQKEEEIRLRLLETVILQTKDSVMITEADFNEKQLPKIVYVNPAFSAISGYQAFEVIGQSPDIFKGPKTDPIAVEKIFNSIRNKQENNIEMICYRRNGEELWLRFTIIPIYNEEQQLSHWISIQKDVTQIKQQEKEKEQLITELTKKNTDLKQFSYITSHNLRAPLSNLIGLLNLVEDIPIEDGELREIIQGLSTSTHLLNDTITDLTKIMVIKEMHNIDKENIAISEVFEKVYAQTTILQSKKKPIIYADFKKAADLKINKSYIESIFTNLLTNAIKYKSVNQDLIIEVSATLVNGSTLIIFKDNGIGIDLKRNKDKVFGLYQKFHNNPNGKGLGLYLVKSQVEAMDGTIAIESEVNIGTKFIIKFPHK